MLPPPFELSARVRGADVTWRFLPGCAGPGYFVCGDTAAVLDPGAPSGVARALASGIEAATLIGRVAKMQIDEGEAERKFRAATASRFCETARQVAKRYAEFNDPPEWLKQAEQELQALESTRNVLQWRELRDNITYPEKEQR
jgi:flavin-dependent dehydrogenase